MTERYGLLARAAAELGFTLSEKDFPEELVGRHYFWSRQQIAVSGIGSVDYRRIFEASEARALVKGKASYLSLHQDVLGEPCQRRTACRRMRLRHGAVRAHVQRPDERRTQAVRQADTATKQRRGGDGLLERDLRSHREKSLP